GIKRKPPHPFLSPFPRLKDRFCQSFVIREKACRLLAKSDHDSTGERCKIDKVSWSVFFFRVRNSISKHESPLSIGVRDFDRFSRPAAVNITGLITIWADGILCHREHADKVYLKFELCSSLDDS